MIFSLLAALSAPAAATVYPYRSVGIGGPNNVYDLDLSMCTGPNGCIDIEFEYCKPGLPQSKANPASPCVVRAVPAGWCAAGSNATNLWPAPAGSCTPAPGVGLVRCGSNADCPAGATCSGATPAAQCTNANASIQCGSLDPQARCSDGDPELRFGSDVDSNLGLGGSGALCLHVIVGAAVEPVNCGREGGVTVASSTGGPRNAGFENAPSAVTPQRNPGTALPTAGSILELRGTYALDIGSPDAYGVRRFSVLGKSSWIDWEYRDKSVPGIAGSAILQPHPFDAPFGWTTDLLIGTCSGGSQSGTLCISSAQCGSGTCGSWAGPWTYAMDEVGFIWTANVDPNVAPDTCPPECGLDYDRSSFEDQALSGVSAIDVNAGRQLALDQLAKTAASGIAARGDAVSVARTFVLAFLDTDARCFIGGDPARLPTFPAKIGLCGDTTGAFCDPATETGNPGSTGTTNDCGVGILCNYCGGRHSSLPAPNGGPSALPVGYADQAGNCAAGHDCSILGLDGRMGGRNGMSFNIKLPLTLTFTTGYARAEVRDATCGTLGIPATSTCLLGAASGTTGIGAGGTFSVGQVFAAGGTCCSGGAPVSWSAANNGATIAGHNGPVGTGDFNPGPNGIPGCIGDNQNGANAPPCGVAGGGRAPGTSSPGTDDTARYSVVLEPGGSPKNASSPPRVEMASALDKPIPNPDAPAPTLRMVAAGSAVDLDAFVPDNLDLLFKTGRVWCPVPLGTGGAGECAHEDSDLDGTYNALDNCPTVPNPDQADADADALGDVCDNCPTITNANQTNSDADAIGDACDNCVAAGNPAVAALAFQTTTGGQLDDDADGFGNECDADFNQAKNKVDSADLDLFKIAFSQDRSVSTCNPGGVSPCDKYDLNNAKDQVDSADLDVFKALFNLGKGPKCLSCPLDCAGDACP